MVMTMQTAMLTAINTVSSIPNGAGQHEGPQSCTVTPSPWSGAALMLEQSGAVESRLVFQDTDPDHDHQHCQHLKQSYLTLDTVWRLEAVGECAGQDRGGAGDEGGGGGGGGLQEAATYLLISSLRSLTQPQTLLLLPRLH